MNSTAVHAVLEHDYSGVDLALTDQNSYYGNTEISAKGVAQDE